jgi:hypothetical protein
MRDLTNKQSFSAFQTASPKRILQHVGGDCGQEAIPTNAKVFKFMKVSRYDMKDLQVITPNFQCDIQDAEREEKEKEEKMTASKQKQKQKQKQKRREKKQKAERQTLWQWGKRCVFAPLRSAMGVAAAGERQALWQRWRQGSMTTRTIAIMLILFLVVIPSYSSPPRPVNSSSSITMRRLLDCKTPLARQLGKKPTSWQEQFHHKQCSSGGALGSSPPPPKHHPHTKSAHHPRGEKSPASSSSPTTLRRVVGVAYPGLGQGIYSGLSNQQQCLVALVFLATKEGAKISLPTLRWRTTFESEDSHRAFVDFKTLWNVSHWESLARAGEHGLPELTHDNPTTRFSVKHLWDV